MLHVLDIMAIAASKGVICNHGKARAFYHEGREQFVVETGGEEYLLSTKHDNPVDAVHFAEEISAAGDESREEFISKNDLDRR